MSERKPRNCDIKPVPLARKPAADPFMQVRLRREASHDLRKKVPIISEGRSKQLR